MKSRQTGPTSVPRALAFCLMAVLLVLTMWAPAALAEGEGGVSDMSLYERASEVTREFGTALAPGAEDEALDMIEPGKFGGELTAGNAGGLLGYADVLADDTGVVGWLMNPLTSGSATITYDQLQNVVSSESAEDAGRTNAFFQYAGYGEALTKMGLATPVRAGAAGGLATGVATGITIIVYLLANAAPFLFQSALFLLVALNPFKLFMGVIEGTGKMDLGILSEVAEYVGGIYTVVQNLSITLLFPMLLALTFVSVLMFRSGSAMKKFSRYGVRVFMLFAGLPLIGATYTGVVEGLDSKVETGADYANYLVLSSYVDFEGWVRETRLAPPGGMEGMAIQNPRTAGENSNERMGLSDRALVLAINGDMAGSSEAKAMSEKYVATAEISEIFATGGDKIAIDDKSNVDPQTKNSFRATFGLLGRHLGSTLYTGSQYDGEVAGRIQKMRSAAGKKADGPIIQMFSLTSSENRAWHERVYQFGGENDLDVKYSKPIKWGDAKGLFTPGEADNEEFVFGKPGSAYDYHIYNGGSLFSAGALYGAKGVIPNEDGNGLAPMGKSPSGVVGGLSPLAMYNFLNTTFTDSGLVVFSPKKSSSDLTRDSYASVSFAGSGVSMWTRWLENVVVMLSLAAVSIAYGIMMLSAALKNIPRILTSVFGTALGSIAFATKLLISTAVMIIQVIGMVFLYTLSENIIMTLLLNFNSVTSSVSQYFGAGTVALEFARGMMVIIVTVAVSIFLIKNMNVFREMMEEVVTNAINRVMGLLDTSTGGQGLDVAKTSGGRVGSDGKLTDDAKADGMLLGGNGIVGGAAGLIGAAHGVEARREQANQERDGGLMLNDDGSEQTAKQRRENRKQTAKDLAGARMRDAGKGMLGIKGKSEEREMEAKDRAIKAISHKDPITPRDKESIAAEAKANKEKENAGHPATNAKGQAIDEDGNVKRDENGNALDAKGNPISSSSPVGVATAMTGVGAGGMAGITSHAMTDKEGNLLDSDGNAYTDENGNAFRQDDKGKLVDENGQHVALDKDGILKPINTLPAHNGNAVKPVSALREAGKLDGMRFDADKFNEMQDAQGTSHYGLDKEGNVVDTDGNAMMARTANGVSPVTMDRDGIVTDKDGNKVAAKDMVGIVDPRGFEEVTDPETGETVMKHKGDSAMKPLAGAALAGVAVGAAASNKKPAKSLTALANQSNKASNLAQRADKRVTDLKANGASPYAIAQAERFAAKANTNAKVAQKDYAGAMKQAGTPAQQSAARPEPVTQAHVQSAQRHAQSVQAALKTEERKLGELKASGAPANVVARQQSKVEAGQREALGAIHMAADTETANKTGRSFNEVSQARNTAQRAEQVFSKAQGAHDAAVQQGAPQAEVQKREQVMQRASAAMVTARSNMNRVTQPPRATPAELDQVTARHTQAQQQHAQAASRVEQLQKQGSPAAVQEAKADEQRAVRNVQQARTTVRQAEQQVQQLQANGAPNSQVVAAKRQVTEVTQQAQQVQAVHAQASQRVEQAQQAQRERSPEVIAQAKASEKQAASGVTQAQTAYKRAQKQMQTLRANGAPQAEVAAAEQQATQAAQVVTQAQSTYTQAKARVENTLAPQQELKQAQRAEQAARRTVNQTARARQTASNPVGWNDNSAPRMQPEPQVSTTRSYAALSSAGVNNYGDYQERVTEQAAKVKSTDAQIKQEKRRLISMRENNRPPQVIQQAEQQIRTLTAESQTAQAALSTLQENAQGLLKNGTFQPTVATRPIRKNGAIVVNQLVNLSNTQAMLDNLVQQSEVGALGESGQRQMTALTSKIGYMKRELVSTGIREDALRDAPTITESTQHMQQSWESFINGTSEEHGE